MRLAQQPNSHRQYVILSLLLADQNPKTKTWHVRNNYSTTGILFGIKLCVHVYGEGGGGGAGDNSQVMFAW